MADTTVENIFVNLVPLEALSLKDVVSGPETQQQGAEYTQSNGHNGSGASSVAQVVRRLNEATSQQSCYFLSADHKDWSVESKIVQTSNRANFHGQSKGLAEGQRKALLAQLAEASVPTEPDQSAPPTNGGGPADFEDPTQEQ